MPLLDRMDLDQPGFNKAADLFAFVNRADEHVHFHVLAEEMFRAKKLRIHLPHPHTIEDIASRDDGNAPRLAPARLIFRSHPGRPWAGCVRQ